jgi:hypothetical protein
MIRIYLTVTINVKLQTIRLSAPSKSRRVGASEKVEE